MWPLGLWICTVRLAAKTVLHVLSYNALGEILSWTGPLPHVFESSDKTMRTVLESAAICEGGIYLMCLGQGRAFTSCVWVFGH